MAAPAATKGWLVTALARLWKAITVFPPAAVSPFITFIVASPYFITDDIPLMKFLRDAAARERPTIFNNAAHSLKLDIMLLRMDTVFLRTPSLALPISLNIMSIASLRLESCP